MSAARPADRRRLAALAVVLLAPVAGGFEFISDFNGAFAAAWNPGTVNVRIQMADAGPLIDGTTRVQSVQAAIADWNAVLGQVQIGASVVPESPNNSGNGINEIYLPGTAAGSTLGGNILGVTFLRYSGIQIVEADIVFNSNWPWDSYRGPRSVRPDRWDLRRVALHELGHLLGLDHPDQANPPQSIAAIMNSRISNIDALQTDDIAGAQALYGAPGAAPANDAFAHATVIDLTTVLPSSFPLVLTGSNAGATKEPGEPAHAGDGGGRSVWWRWTAPSSGSVSLTTLGSRYDTTLAVYTGASVGALTAVASNNDAQGTTVRTSALTFSASAGVTYHFAVDGAAGDAGPLALNFAFAAGGTAPPSLRIAPTGVSVSAGAEVTFSVTADRATSYQWLLNGNPIPGATGSSYTVSSVEAATAGQYRVRVTNSAGTVTSPAAAISLLAAAPPALVVAEGRSVSAGAPTSNNYYQWQVSTNGTTWSNLANDSTYGGVTTSTLTISNATAALNGLRYRARLTGAGSAGNSTATTAPAALTVGPLLAPFPVGVVADGAGGFLVADASDDVILRVTAEGVVSVFAGARGQAGSADGAAAAARFNDPTGLVRAPDGTVFVADTANATLRQISPAGAVTTLAGSPGSRGNQNGTGTGATFTAPGALARDADGNLYVSDAQSHVIRRVTPAGVVTTFAGTAGSAGDSDGTGAAARFNQPAGLAFDAAGNLFVADSGNHTIRRLTPAGAVTTFAGVPGVNGVFDAVGLDALLAQPTGLARAADGNLYFSDVGNSTVRRLAPDGTVTTIAGLTRISGQKDGTGREVWFNQPRALAAAGDGLVVADTANGSIRRITVGGTVTTVPLATSAPPPPPPPPAPSPTPTPTPAPSSGGGGGGGGSPSALFALAAAAALLARRLRGSR
jgi:sugar lactone lactonase YvrE